MENKPNIQNILTEYSQKALTINPQIDDAMLLHTYINRSDSKLFSQDESVLITRESYYYEYLDLFPNDAFMGSVKHDDIQLSHVHNTLLYAEYRSKDIFGRMCESDKYIQELSEMYNKHGLSLEDDLVKIGLSIEEIQKEASKIDKLNSKLKKKVKIAAAIGLSLPLVFPFFIFSVPYALILSAGILVSGALLGGILYTFYNVPHYNLPNHIEKIHSYNMSFNKYMKKWDFSRRFNDFDKILVKDVNMKSENINSFDSYNKAIEHKITENEFPDVMTLSDIFKDVHIEEVSARNRKSKTV